MLDSLDHVILAVRDLEAATRETALLLGRRPSWRGEHPSAGSANTLFRLSNTYLELLSPSGPGPVGDLLKGILDLHGDGPLGLVFGTRDAEACRKELEQRGLEPGAVERGLGRDVESGAIREWLRVPIPFAKTRGLLLFAIEHRSPAEMLPPAAPACAEPAAVSGLDHAVVETSEPEAAKALYGDGLGLRLALDREFPQWGARLIFYRIGGITVELAARLEAPTPGPGRDRFYGLSWRVPDADAARARLVDAGIDASEVRPGRKPGTRVLSVRSGSCGVPTLFIEPPGAEG
ncbi:MAG TPA: VOC family protein [Myxococcota bacterium]|nr:VOC family protein [Myxococcota bacterium]